MMTVTDPPSILAECSREGHCTCNEGVLIVRKDMLL